jgi:hypothetical protein
VENVLYRCRNGRWSGEERQEVIVFPGRDDVTWTMFV